MTRAEPIAALYEQGRVHHVGTFGVLEDQMCDFDPNVAQKSPDRMDALVWALTEISDTVSLSTITPGVTIYASTGVSEYACETCSHRWTAQLGDVPKHCPQCGSSRWDREALFQTALTGLPRPRLIGCELPRPLVEPSTVIGIPKTPPRPMSPPEEAQSHRSIP